MFSSLKPTESDALRSGVTWFNPQAGPLFERAFWRGRVNRTIARLFRRSWRLHLLNDWLSPDLSCHTEPHNIRAVELRSIRGSVNRSDEFDRNFNPLTDRLATRWTRIASMMLQQTGLPPVELIRVRNLYFVVDGHHRVSVARSFGHATIDAILVSSYD